ANYAWLQHMLARLSSRGRAGVVLANGSMSSQQSGEGEIRQNMVIKDVVECMVALPGQLFSNTQIPACLWFLSRDKRVGPNGKADRSNQILFIDARKSASSRISRTQVEFTDADMARIAQTYHRWRNTVFSDGESYEDVPGFCYSASYEDVQKHGFVLTPGRYVGAEEVEDDDEPFGEKMDRLTDQLVSLIAERNSIEQDILQKLKGMGYEF
ncbi:N-6 DNA methylase, partial [Pseudomonas aeruginosa]